MKSQIDNAGIFGYIKVFITRENGFKELVFEDKNAIQPAYANAIVDALDTGVGLNYSMDNLFDGNTQPPTTGEDGIAIKESGGLWYEMDMDTPVVSSGEVLWVGTFTGVTITVADANSVNLGHDYQAPFTNLFAKPSSWSSQVVQSTETLTIEWTIAHQST